MCIYEKSIHIPFKLGKEKKEMFNQISITYNKTRQDTLKMPLKVR